MKVLHVFPTSKQVDAHNKEQLENLAQPVETIVAVDKKKTSILRDFKTIVIQGILVACQQKYISQLVQALC